VAFAILALQVLIQVRSQNDANARQKQADRQALLLLLGRQRNLSGLDLHKQDLSAAYLNDKVLRGSDLVRAKLKDARLQDAVLSGADLRSAVLDDAHLERADLRDADLAGASLVGAKLSGANLDAADLSPRHLSRHLVRVDLTSADLSDAYLRSDLRGALLAKATLTGASLAPADLQGADLSGADLSFADLRGANLTGANLAHAQHLDAAKDLSYATFDAATDWPRGFTWEFPHRRCAAAKCVTTWQFERPRCTRNICTLPRKRAPVFDAPPELQSIRAQLGRALTGDCLPGWWIDVQPSDIEAHAPRDRASFHVSTALVGQMTAARWAKTFGHSGVRRLGGISAAERSAYAETYADTGARPPLTAISVYYVRRGRGFHLLGTAPTAIFPLFERNFARLFRSAGVAGDLFPTLRGATSECAA
jgi:uncharacterized protein YjbI with pentapeptide repeats